MASIGEGRSLLVGADARRPLIHFTPPSGWLNDPNGLVFAKGLYHLFYQHNPHSTSWGPMHWGHATSDDLISWTHRPIALAPDKHGLIFSGSAVIDSEDSAGFGSNTLVALFTYHALSGDSPECQGLAWSRDQGEEFTKLDAPILEAPPGITDFRDPTVFWFDGASSSKHISPSGNSPAGSHWIMLLAAGQAVEVYTSSDLRNWAHASTLRDAFADSGTWEMPELIRFEADDDVRWVLAVSLTEGAPHSGSGVQAVVGDFDGSVFVPTDPTFWVDFGPDYYAPQAWNSAPGGRRVWAGWAGNWRDVSPDPNAQWCGQMSIPRELSLIRTGGGLRLKQEPVAELTRYYMDSLVLAGAEISATIGVPLALKAPALDFDLELDSELSSEDAVIIEFRRADKAATLQLDLDRDEIVLTLDSNQIDRPTSPAAYRAPLGLTDGAGESIRVLLDTASIEVFAGASVITVKTPALADPWSVVIESLPSVGSTATLTLNSIGSPR